MNASDLVLRLLINAEDKTGPAMKSARSELGSLEKSAKQLSDLVKGYLTFQVVFNGLKELTDVAVKFDRINAVLKQVSGSTQAAEKEFSFVSDTSKALGLELAGTAMAYAKLAASSKGTALEGEQTRRIFSAISNAMARTGASASETEGALLAIGQMMSKGSVQAEELRGQLGERLPGAFGLAAKAMGVTTAQLGDMLEKGGVLADDLLPKLAQELDKTYGTGKIDTMAANLNRLDNAWTRLMAGMAEAGNLQGGLSLLEGKIEKLADRFVAIAEIAKTEGGLLEQHDAIIRRMAENPALEKYFGFYQRKLMEVDIALERVQAQQSQAAASTESMAERQAVATGKQQENLKAATTIIDAEFARQTQAGEQALSARLAQIAASGLAENLQAQLTAAAERQSATARLTAIADYGQRRLGAIGAQLGTESELEKLGAASRQAAEQASLQARMDAYGDLANAYSQVVGQLQGLWQQEMVLFNQGNEALKALATSHEADILALKRLGMGEREKLRSQELERDAAIAKFKAEAAKGEQADEKELNRLYGEAKKLVNEVAGAKVAGSTLSMDKNAEIRKGESLLNDLYDTQQSTLGRLNDRHKENADTLLPTLDTAKGKLSEVNTALGEMDRQLANSKQLKIELDQASVSAAQSTIAALTAPATKTITIQTVNAGSGTPAQGKALGGMIHALSSGGKLPGYGGGDTVPAMLEPGEYIINKAATAKALPLLEMINKGRLPGYAGGGLVEKAFEKGFESSLDKKLVQFINAGIAASSSNGLAEDWMLMDQILRDIEAAIKRAPASIRESLKGKVSEKLSGILGDAQWSVNMATENQFNPLATVQNSPNTIEKAENKARYFQKALSRFGGPKLGGAALGGFAPHNPLRAEFAKYASPNFNIPGMVGNAMAPVAALNNAQSQQTNGMRAALAPGEVIEINLRSGERRVPLYAAKADKATALDVFRQLEESRGSSQ